jgi:2,2-dialkylglycine decarboxylase (pyruvate)
VACCAALFVDFGKFDAAAISNAVTYAALDHGLLANATRLGTAGGMMRIAPPLTATDEEIDLGIKMLDAAIKSVVEH